MFERFTKQARQVVMQAQEEARLRRDPKLGSHHLLIGLADSDDDLVSQVLRTRGLDAATLRRRLADDAGDALDAAALAGVGIDLDAVRRATEDRFGAGALDPSPHGLARGRIPLSSGARKSLELALRSAVRLRSGEITTGHLLLGVIDEGLDSGAGLLRDCRVDLTGLRAEVIALLAPRAA